MRLALRTLVVACLLATALAQPAQAFVKPPNPCLDREQRARLRCPDLTMSKPFGLTLDRLVKPGRVVLRAGNSINSVGRGPAELHGRRIAPKLMRGRQRIYKRAGGRIGITTGAQLLFKHIPSQGGYWKFRYAARFELWRRNRDGERTKLVRVGPKASYCLRDLVHSSPGLRRSPLTFFYPGCNMSSSTQRITLGTSVGWSDVYPPAYHEQWIDVTGLRGCFDYVHIADPRNGIYESNERNNSAKVVIRLPYKPGPQRCSGSGGAAPSPDGPSTPYEY